MRTNLFLSTCGRVTPSSIMKEGRSSRRRARDAKKKAVIICLGNPQMRDDGIGMRVATELRRNPPDRDVVVYAYRDLDLSLIDKVEGAEAVVLVDALQSGKPPGTISTYEIGQGKHSLSVELPSLHGLGLAELFGLARQAGLLDGTVTVVGVEPRDCTPGRRISREVASAVPKILKAVASSLYRAGAIQKRPRGVQTGERVKPLPTKESN